MLHNWRHDDNDKIAFVKWTAYHAAFEHELMKQVTNFVREKFPDYNSYKLSCKSIFKKKKIINIEDMGLNNHHFQEARLMEIYKLKFTKGERPQKDFMKLSYSKKYVHCHFQLADDVDADKIHLELNTCTEHEWNHDADKKQSITASYSKNSPVVQTSANQRNWDYWPRQTPSQRSQTQPQPPANPEQLAEIPPNTEESYKKTIGGCGYNYRNTDKKYWH